MGVPSFYGFSDEPKELKCSVLTGGVKVMVANHEGIQRTFFINQLALFCGVFASNLAFGRVNLFRAP